jgi:zinc finger FYVE domain-containing protein 26
MSRTAEGAAAVQDLDFHSLGSQLSPLAMILLCIDAAASSAKSPTISKQLLDKSQVMLSEIYPGGAPKVGFTYWDQVHEVAIISVLRRILKRLQEFLEQDDPQILQASFSGDTIISSCTESHRQGQKDRALAMLHQMIEDAHRGKRQFLSGKLHNLARALADEKPEVDVLKGDGSDMAVEKDGVLGLGLKYTKQSPGSANRAVDGNPVSHETEDKGKKSFGPLSNKTSTYLSQFILYTAAIGDIVDGTDTTHDFNFFSLVYEWPKDLLTRLVFDRSSTDAAAKVAEVMSADFVHEVISACVPPVYPPRSGHGWACIPVIPTTPCSHSEGKVLSPSIEAKPNCYVRSSATPGVPLYPLQLDVIRHLVKISPVRAVLACVFGGSILYNGSDSIISSSLNDEFPSSPDADRLFYEFSLDQSERYPTLNRWIQMQTNLHRVSEFVVTPKQKPDDTRIKPDERTGIKRLLEHDSDSESDTEETFSKNNIQPALTDGSARDGGSFENGVCRTDPTVFLSFDWENEVPYEKAVNRLIDEGKLMDALALSDRFLRNGASDWLLQLLIKSREENPSTSGRSQGYGGQSNSWQYCLRLKDKQLAATLALKYMHTWELEAALNVLTMCSCHLLESDPISLEVLHRRQALQKYSHILSADDRHNSWQEVIFLPFV